MRALAWHGNGNFRSDSVPDPKIEGRLHQDRPEAVAPCRKS
jgi:hypothetical protein